MALEDAQTFRHGGTDSSLHYRSGPDLVITPGPAEEAARTVLPKYYNGLPAQLVVRKVSIAR